MTTNQLEICLDDHNAGAAGGTRLARRIHRSNADGPWAQEREALVEEIAEERRILESVRKELGFEGGGLKSAIAIVAERAGRLKLNGTILGYSALSRVVELEALTAAVSSKRYLWSALHSAAKSRPEIQHDFDALRIRSDHQIELLDRIHKWAVQQAFDE